MRVTLIAVLIAIIGALAACQSRQERTRIDPLPNHFPPGSTFTLNEELTLPADGSPLYFQDTQLHARQALEPDFPHCEFRRTASSKVSAMVEPQVMNVSATTFDGRKNPTGDGIISMTTIELESADTSSRYKMSCAPARATPSAEFVTPEEVIGVLGSYFKVELAS